MVAYEVIGMVSYAVIGVAKDGTVNYVQIRPLASNRNPHLRNANEETGILQSPQPFVFLPRFSVSSRSLTQLQTIWIQVDLPALTDWWTILAAPF